MNTKQSGVPTVIQMSAPIPGQSTMPSKQQRMWARIKRRSGAEQEQGSVRSSGNAENKGQPKPSDREMEREKESPTDTRSDARSEVLETQNAELQHRVEEKTGTSVI